MIKGIIMLIGLVGFLALSYKGYRYIRHNILQNNIALEYINKPVPQTSGKDIKGQIFKLESYKGKNVIIVFWATWCRFCVKEIPDIIKFQNTLTKDSDIVIISSILDKDIKKAKEFISKKKINYTVIIDEINYGAESEFNRPFKIVNIPSIWVINKEGIVIAQNLTHFDDAIEKLK